MAAKGDMQASALYVRLIRDVPGFPQPGVLFRDITPLLNDAAAFRQAVIDLAAPFKDQGIDQVVAIEARGYLLGAPMALELGAGFVPVRKIGKLPNATYQAQYDLEYGSASIEMHQDALLDHHRVLIVDDVLATGGTMAATLRLVEHSGAQVVGIAVLIELTDLNGRSRLGSHPLFSLIKY
jgi:adenine phosphoribosyltransferase